MIKATQTPYINRELSWLDFNSRVLEEAMKQENPLLERKKFLSIYSSNMDEFYMVRVGSLLDQSLSEHDFKDSITGMSVDQQLSAIYQKSSEMDKAFIVAVDAVHKELNAHNIRLVRPQDMHDQDELKKMFNQRILPVLSPVVLDGKHPFPYIANKSIFCGVRLKTKNDKTRTGIVLFPENVDKHIFLQSDDDEIRYGLFEDIVEYFIENVFAKYTVLDSAIFKVVRNADLILDDEAIEDEMDYKQAMVEVLRQRRWLSPVRLLTTASSGSALVLKIAKALSITQKQTFLGYPYLYTGLAWDLIPVAQEKSMRHLMFDKIERVYPTSLDKRDSLIYQILKRDHLLVHPYERFEAVIDLLKEAASDPHVVSIRQTLYRVSKHSAIINALAVAAENGKDVTVLVELKARFDEQNNLNYANVLEEAGCRVIYGKDNLKVHSKALLITRKGKRGFEYICHLGTGNYNENTAKLYTDIGILTADRDIGEDLLNFFNDLSGSLPNPYKKLFVSPNGIRNAVYKMIDQEVFNAHHGLKAHIIVKLNSIADKGMVDKLIYASQSGVKVQLIVRGICCIRAGLAGYTSNIEVKSIVGRFLEHSRIFWFYNNGNDKMQISSADWMTRNLDRRMEIACPVQDKNIMAELKHSLDVMLKDFGKGRYMTATGDYVHSLKKQDNIADSQMSMYYETLEKANAKAETQRNQKGKYVLRKNLANALIRLANRIYPRQVGK